MRRRRKHRKIKIGSKESHISFLKSFKSSLILTQYKKSQSFSLEKLVKKTTILVFLPLCPIRPKCHFAQVYCHIVFLTNVFSTKRVVGHFDQSKSPIINLTTSKLSHHYLWFDVCHILSSLYYIFEGDNIVCCRKIPNYLQIIYNHISTMYMYIVYMTTYKFHTHGSSLNPRPHEASQCLCHQATPFLLVKDV